MPFRINYLIVAWLVGALIGTAQEDEAVGDMLRAYEAQRSGFERVIPLHSAGFEERLLERIQERADRTQTKVESLSIGPGESTARGFVRVPLRLRVSTADFSTLNRFLNGLERGEALLTLEEFDVQAATQTWVSATLVFAAHAWLPTGRLEDPEQKLEEWRDRLAGIRVFFRDRVSWTRTLDGLAQTLEGFPLIWLRRLVNDLEEGLRIELSIPGRDLKQLAKFREALRHAPGFAGSCELKKLELTIQALEPGLNHSEVTHARLSGSMDKTEPHPTIRFDRPLSSQQRTFVESYHRGDWEQVARVWRDSVRNSNPSRSNLLAVSWSLIQLKRFQQAAAALEQLSKEDPDGLLLQARLLEARGGAQDDVRHFLYLSVRRGGRSPFTKAQIDPGFLLQLVRASTDFELEKTTRKTFFSSPIRLAPETETPPNKSD